ncbi:MAG: ATPase [Planktomarina sp.]
MIYKSADDWLAAPKKRVCLFAMSGLGKTHVSNMLRHTGGWFHYSIDYRIGTRYMGEYIVDNFKKVAMTNPFLADLLRSDSIYIGSNITFENLNPLSTYLGKPGDTALGGIPIDEYRKRQDQHDVAEVSALLDTPHFIDRAQNLYGYGDFVCDTGGSIVEVVDPNDPNDPVMNCLSQNTLMVWIKGADAHLDRLIARFDSDPKPMCYTPEFLTAAWDEFCTTRNVAPDKVNPDEFIRFTYAKAITRREPKYADMAKWGVTVTAEEIAACETPALFDALIAQTLEEQA